MKIHIRILFIIISLTYLVGCKDKSRFKINTSENRVVVKIKRYDKAIATFDKINPERSIKQLYKDFPEFTYMYANDLLGINPHDTLKLDSLFVNFTSDKTFSKVNQQTLNTFADVSTIEKQVSDAYTYIKHYFPQAKLPEIYFFVSGFNRAVMMNQNIIAFGTDMYLGKDYPLYKDIAYKYLRNNMRPECLPVDIVSVTLFRMFAINSDQDRLLENMLFRGKVMYFLSVCMQETKPEDIMGYTSDQMEWCQKFEKEIWASIIEHKDLFSTDIQLINKYLNEAPFTAPISQQSPGRLGTWVGWRIVDSYMQKHKNVDLPTLMRESNYQKILQESGYKP